MGVQSRLRGLSTLPPFSLPPSDPLRPFGWPGAKSSRDVGIVSLIYVLAAYSITLCTLALYGVLIQHRARVYVQDQSLLQVSVHPGVLDSGRRGVNLGAALLTPFWMWEHGMRPAGAVLFVLCLAIVPLYQRELWVPLLFVAIIPLAAGTALAFVGNRIAVNHRVAETGAEFSASQLPWSIAGIILFTIVLPWLWYFSNATA